MKKTFCIPHTKSLFVLLLCILNFSSYAVVKSNFTGNYKLNKSKSTLNTEFSLAPTQIIILHEKNDINIERLTKVEGSTTKISEKFTLDGKECINDSHEGSKKYSTVIWDKGHACIKIKTKIVGAYGTMNTKQNYSLYNNCLKVECLFSTSFGDVKETWVLYKE